VRFIPHPFHLANIIHKFRAGVAKKLIVRFHRKRGSAEEQKLGSFLLAPFRAYELTRFIKSYRIQDVY